MKHRSFMAVGLAGFLATVGCGKSEENLELGEEKANSVVRMINGEEYRFGENRVTQVSSDENDLAKFGIISDAHGEVEKARALAREFKKRRVDGIIMLGDLCVNERLRYGRRDSRSDRKEIEEVLEAVAETGFPVFVIPGNHERTKDYEFALGEITKKFDNVIDMTRYRVFDGDDVDFVSLPGYQTKFSVGRQFIPDDGFWARPDFVKTTGRLREGLDDFVVLIAHGAGKTDTNGKRGPATIYSGSDVGDEATRRMMIDNDIGAAVVGNIHEAGGYAAMHDGKIVNQGEWVHQFTANFGGLERWKNLNGRTYEGMGGIITVKGDKIKFDMIYLK